MSAAPPPPAPRPPQPQPQSRSQPQPQRHAAAEGWLTPRRWSLEEAPPAADALSPQANSGEPPLLLLIDRRQPLSKGCLLQQAATLSPEERQRHSAYRLAGDRERFLLARAGLRRLLGAWLDLAPGAVPLESGYHGKPHCPGGPAFNVSHAGDLILLALHPERPVGVDVERLRPDRDWPAIARRVLLPAEIAAIENLPVAERPEGCLAAWCRLEARLKARGDGLAGLERLRQKQVLAPQQQGEPEPQAGPKQRSSGSWRGDPASADLPRSGHRASACLRPVPEQLWNVRVPAGYRAAVALAPPSP
ncbi:MAG: 4'-phosphopantetheinyl transferase family protein [Cyanobium sp.]